MSRWYSNGIRMISGWRHKMIRLVMALYVIREVLIRYRATTKAIHIFRVLLSNYRTYKYALGRIAKHNSKYYINLSVQGWPSPAYDRYLHHLMDHLDGDRVVSLHTAIFAITNICGFDCEHCVEWDNVNKPDRLSNEDILKILDQLHDAGVAQVLFSGGEPLSRYRDLLYILEKAPKGIEYWIFTNGWKLNAVKAWNLQQKGLTGMIVSIDHFDPAKHDTFRGKKGAFERAVHAIQSAREASLLTCITVVATNDFVEEENVMKYLYMARDLGVDFVQFLEPEAEGRYRNKDVALSEPKRALLEKTFLQVNGSPEYRDFPLITYYPYMKRLAGCAGRGLHYLYVDADGDVHPCPFCRRKMFSALDDNFKLNIEHMRSEACAFSAGIGSIFSVPEAEPHPLPVRT